MKASRYYLILSVIYCIVLAIGCSGASIPDVPDVNPAIENGQTLTGGQLSDRTVWGVWDISIDPVTYEASITYDRELANHFNVTAVVTPPKCTDCVVVKVVNVDQATHIYTIDVTLKNPTALTGYDVRGTLLFPDGDSRKLTNADAYTTIFTSGVKSPFMAYAKDQAQRKFLPKATQVAQYKILFPPPSNLNVTYVVDASYPSNQEEPYSFSNTNLDGSVSDNGLSKAWLYTTVSDWQNNVASVTLDLSSIGANPVVMQSQGSGMYKGIIDNKALKPVGTYTLWIRAKSTGSDNELLFPYELNIATQTEAPFPPHGELGLLYNSTEAYDGYTLLAPKHNGSTYLIDNEGRVIHSWNKSKYEPGQTVYLLENGHLLRACMLGGGVIGGGEGGLIEEYDWDDNLVWQFTYKTDTYQLHHDIMPLPNGNIIAIADEVKPKSDAIDAGFDPQKLQDPNIAPDYVVEIQKQGASGGLIVWEWHVWDHLIQDNDPGKSNFGVVAQHPELISVDGAIGNGIPVFWNHMNAIDYNSEFDQILLSVRNFSEVWVIDHGTTTSEASSHSGGTYGKGGDLIYRWGNPASYGVGNTNDRKYYEPHDAQWIREGCPGAGNILIFNNGCNRPGGNYSSVDEMVPAVNIDGSYPISPGSPYGPADGLGTWHAPNPPDMYDSDISGAQRQPNGNTLICDGVHGVLFEVTSAGKIVWLYVNPVTDVGPLKQGDPIPLDVKGHQMNAVFTIQRYAKDYAGLSGKDLTPGDPLV